MSVPRLVALALLGLRHREELARGEVEARRARRLLLDTAARLSRPLPPPRSR
jgi:hypothetical protein